MLFPMPLVSKLFSGRGIKSFVELIGTGGVKTDKGTAKSLSSSKTICLERSIVVYRN